MSHREDTAKIGTRAFHIKSGPHCDRIACERNGVNRRPSKRSKWGRPECPDCDGEANMHGLHCARCGVQGQETS